MVGKGRPITAADVELITCLVRDNPKWNRRRLSRELCEIWQWYDAHGGLRDMSCRALLLKLHRSGRIVLPAPQRPGNNDYRRWEFCEVAHDSEPIREPLQALGPLRIVTADGDTQRRELVRYLLHRYHYLQYRGSSGRCIWYLVYDRHERLLACLIFGGAALKVKSRDSWIGWNTAARRWNLRLIANNQRFLILPWVEVKCLASHVLAKISARVGSDWYEKYGHEVCVLETFVDRSRFDAVCYRAANWICVGTTVGRTRNDRHTRIKAPVKDIYMYPLTKHFRRQLCRDDG